MVERYLLNPISLIGKRTFNIEQLQDILKVPKSLKVYADFKRKELKKAEIDINKFTDLEVKLSEKKRARKVLEVTYTIKKNLEEAKKHIYLALAFSKSISKITMFIKR